MNSPFSEPASRWRWKLAGVALLLVILVGELAGATRHQSQTWDEPYHMLAGYRFWQAYDFGINSEHPPLVKGLAAAPLLFFRPGVPHVPVGTSKREGFVAARQFLYSNDASRLLLASRFAVGIFLVLLAFLVFEGARRMFGDGAGWAALVLIAFEPNLLAHGALVTTDGAEACCLFAAVYAFYRYLDRPSALRLVECGIASGLALAAKHSGLLVFPVLILLAFTEFWVSRSRPGEPAPAPATERESPAHIVLKLALVLVGIALIAIATLWSTYAFRYTARPSPKGMTPPLAEYIRGVGTTPGLRNPLERDLILALDRSRLLPQAYVYGLADVMIVARGPRPAFVLGNLYPSARWFYFPVTFAVKTTLGLLLLLVLAVVALAWGGRDKRREVLFMALPPVFYMAVTLTSGLDIGVRHILPVYPPLIVLAGAAAWALIKRGRAWRYVALGAVALHVASSLATYPDYLAYSNEIFGGTSGTYRYLSDSNADWGQGLIELKAYTERRGIRDCWLAYFGSADPDYYSIPCKKLPETFSLWWGKPVDIVPRDFQGTVFIGVSLLAGLYTGPGILNPYSAFQSKRPTANVGGSILAFDGRFDLTSAAAESHANRAWELYASHRLEEALAEARLSITLDPRVPYTHYTLAYLLAEKKQRIEARKEFAAALELARTVLPEYQWYWIPYLQGLLKRL